MISLPSRGLDSWRAWLTALVCGLIHLFASLSLAAMGSIFSGTLEDFSSERENASWPVTAMTCSMQIVAPLFSVLVYLGASHKWILRACTFTTSMALILCCFAKDIVLITILLAVHGSSLSGIYMSANVVMAGHFKNQRTAATGMQECIAGISVFFMPALMNSIINRFRTSLGICVLGVITSACFVLSFCIQPFKDEHDSIPSRQKRREDVKLIELPCENLGESSISVEEATSADIASDIVVCDEAAPSETNLFTWRTLFHPMYLFDVFSFLVVFECLASFFQLTADYSNDRGVPEGATWLVPIFGVGDMVFKISSGLLSDAKFISPAALMLSGSLVQCFAFIVLSYASTLAALLFASCLMGVSNGCRIILFIIVLINDFGLENLSHAFSFANFFIGIATLLKPFLVGYFRDRLGEYLGLFLVLASLNAITGIYWMVRVLLDWRRRRTTLTPQNSRK